MTNDPDDDVTVEEVYKSPFGIEMERRKAHIEALPGARFKEDLEALNRASYVFGTNGQELAAHVWRFVNSQMNVQNLDDQYVNELVRLLHNYLTSVSSLIDAQRVVVRHCWPDEKDPERVAFQAEYDKQRTGTFETDEAAFVTKLRNYCTHYAIPLPGLGTSISHSWGGPVIQVNTLQLDRDRLLRWSGWGGSAKSYLGAQPDKFDLAPIIERYMAATRTFYEWFWNEVNERNRSIRDELQEKAKELFLWHQECNYMPDWFHEGRESGPPGWSAARDLAHLRAERFAYGTRGYVAHIVTRDGVIEMREDPWWPFPDRV
ncbi:hypothetical protein [Gordonia polyisoprenivorans]|uniref:hypothetical protein n=1 Tax=Gordonia polyisoprenivorans TaxID=84595 RepID=UPI001AD74BA4|nr:hypothetical protein [Gordonia polyisoprenivorans]QTI67478.1 hypothetical protein J6U32_17990 [Gordonia polyisoprenivorans]